MEGKARLYNQEGVLQLLSCYLASYQADVAKSIQLGRNNPDFENLVSGAKGQHFDPLIWAISVMTGRSARDICEAVIMAATSAAQQGVTTRLQIRPRPKKRKGMVNR